MKDETLHHSPGPIWVVVLISVVVFGGVSLAYWIGSHYDPETHRGIVGGFAAFIFWTSLIGLLIFFAKGTHRYGEEGNPQ